MGNQDECAYCLLAEVRSDGTKKGKLLFQLAEGEDGLMIIVKLKGDDTLYYVPVFLLLEPFFTDVEELKRLTRLNAYEENIKENTNEKIK